MKLLKTNSITQLFINSCSCLTESLIIKPREMNTILLPAPSLLIPAPERSGSRTPSSFWISNALQQPARPGQSQRGQRTPVSGQIKARRGGKRSDFQSAAAAAAAAVGLRGSTLLRRTGRRPALFPLRCVCVCVCVPASVNVCVC